MQNRINSIKPLLNDDGCLSEAGYSTKMLLTYDRKKIKASRFKIKEWDYYYIGNKHYGVALTIADNSYLGMISVSMLNFDEKSQVTRTQILPFTFGKLSLPSNSVEGDVGYKNKVVDIAFANNGKHRKIRCLYKNFNNGSDIDIDIELSDNPMESMVIATPFHNAPKAFYYNQKINCMSANGNVKLEGKTYNFSGGGDMGLLDWGRGVWTYNNTWYWSSLSTVLPDGRKFGFNLGYGFGDNSKATENMLFVEGVADKLEDVCFHIPKDKYGKDDYMSEWKFSSSDGRIKLRFVPILNRKAYTSIIVVASDQNQVFGAFYGTIVRSNGEVVELNGEVGFAEKVKNRW